MARRCGIREMEAILRQRRLQWFGDLRRAGQDSVVKMVEVEERRPVGRPRKTWRKCRAKSKTVGIEGGDGPGQERVEKSLTVQPYNGKRRT